MQSQQTSIDNHDRYNKIDMCKSCGYEDLARIATSRPSAQSSISRPPPPTKKVTFG